MSRHCRSSPARPPQRDHPLALLVERAKRGARALWRDQENVEVPTRLDEAEAHRKAMAEAQRCTLAKVRFDLGVELRMDLIGASIMTTSAAATASSINAIASPAASASAALPDAPRSPTTTSIPLSCRLSDWARPWLP